MGDAHTGDSAVVTLRGGSWVTLPVAPQGAFLKDVQITSASNVWISGTLEARREPTRPLVMHFDGMRWSRFVLDGIYGETAIDTRGPANTWLVGLRRGARRASSVPTAWHWDGARWQAESPATNAMYPDLTGVYGGPDERAWAIGLGDSGNCCNYTGIVLRRDAAGWEEIPLDRRARCSSCWFHEPHDLLVNPRTGSITIFGLKHSHDGGSGILSRDGPIAETYDGDEWITERIRGYSVPPGADAVWTAADSDGQGGAWAVGRVGSRPVFIRKCT